MSNNLNTDIRPGNRSQPCDTAPAYRTATAGLNLDAHCASCDKQVIVPRGFSEEEGFSLASLMLQVVCPLCAGPIPPAQIGCLWLHRCAYKMKARAQDGGVSKTADTVEELLDYPLTVDKNSAPASVIIKVFPIPRQPPGNPAPPETPRPMPPPRC